MSSEEEYDIEFVSSGEDLFEDLEEEQKFQSGFSDRERVQEGKLGTKIQDKGERAGLGRQAFRDDPVQMVIATAINYLKNYLDDGDGIPENKIRFVNKYLEGIPEKRLILLNGNVLAVAILFILDNGTKININNFKKFLENHTTQFVNPLDIIRYIRYLNTIKK